ncbi:hypothetical protein EP56_01585 [Listeriaceae bacterium FSL A5-0209]|nr:hypothetical protein EP56_01585 [Listeriaceae bacterium FSL A5-0209]
MENDINVGQTIKEIRKNKKIKQREFPPLSRGTVANIESEERTPAPENFQLILAKLDITLQEFDYIKNGFKLTTREALIKEFIDHKHSLYSERTINLARNMDVYLVNNPNDQVIKDYKVVLNVYKTINEAQAYKVNKAEQIATEEIWNRIDRQKIWYYYDIDLMTRIFYVFKLEIAWKIIQDTLKQMDRYENYAHYGDSRKTKQAFLLNSAKFLINRGDFKNARPLLEKAKLLTHEHESVILELYSLAALATINYVENKISKYQANNEIARLCTLFVSLGREQFANDIHNDWESFKQEYNPLPN